MAQFAGGIVGAAVLWLLTSGFGDVTDQTGALGANDYGATISLGGAFLLEALLTFAFVAVILLVTGRAAAPGFAGLAIGLTLTAVHLVGIPLTGTSVNPARSLGPALFTGGEPLAHVWLFILAPLVGAALAAVRRAAARRAPADGGSAPPTRQARHGRPDRRGASLPGDPAPRRPDARAVSRASGRRCPGGRWRDRCPAPDAARGVRPETRRSAPRRDHHALPGRPADRARRLPPRRPGRRRDRPRAGGPSRCAGAAVDDQAVLRRHAQAIRLHRGQRAPPAAAGVVPVAGAVNGGAAARRRRRGATAGPDDGAEADVPVTPKAPSGAGARAES